MSREAIGAAPERIALSALFLAAAQSESGTANAWVECYDMASFGQGVPSIRRRSALGDDIRPVEPGDVLLSRLVSAPRRAWVVATSRGRPQVASSDWLVLRSVRFDPDFLRHVLVSNDFRLRFERAAKRHRRRHAVAAADVAAIDIPLPCREVQERLGRVLQHADALRSKRQAVATRLARLPVACAIEMLAIARDSGWPQVRLGELRLGAARSGASGSDATGPWLLVRAANIGDERVDTGGCATAAVPGDAYRGRSVAAGDLLVTRPQGAERARVAIADPGTARWLAHEELVKVTVDAERVHPEYVRAVVAGDAVCAPAPVTAVSAEHFARRVAEVMVPLPPPAAHARFVGIVAAARALDAKLQASAHRLDALLGVLRDAVFRGDLGEELV